MYEPITCRPATNVIEFYEVAIVLKQVIRSGWKQWNVKRERLESVAEHVYGTCMLAIAMASEYNYNIDIKRVVMMMAIHELEETVIPDITPIDNVSAEEKLSMGHKAIVAILSPLANSTELINIILEFDARKTPEAKFAYQCDKLECDLMSIMYDRQDPISFDDATALVKNAKHLKDMHDTGVATSMADFFYLYDKEKYDENFSEVLNEMYER